MFRAIGRYFKAVGYLLTGNIDKAREQLSKDPAVIRATYAEIIREKTGRIREYRDAVAGLVTQEEKKRALVKRLTEETTKLEQLKTGALAKAKKRGEALKAAGKSIEEIHHDEDYLRCRAAFSDFSSTLAEKSARIDELESDISGYEKKISGHKIQLQQLLRDLEKLRSEADEAVADVISAQEETQIADMLTNLSQDGTTQELNELRDLRHKVKAEARIATELAGTDSRVEEAEFLDYARKSEDANEFDALIGLAEKVDAAPEAPDAAIADGKLPQ